MELDNPEAEIAKDIQDERKIIEMHKDRQAQILNQISEFKSQMQLQIEKLTQQNESVLASQDKNTKDGQEKSTNLEESIRLLIQKLSEIRQINQASLLKKEGLITNNLDVVEKLKLEIQGKNTKIDEMNKEKNSNNQKNSSIEFELATETGRKVSLKKEIDKIASKIKIETVNNANLINMDKEHKAKILSNIDLLKHTTDEMQQELVKSIEVSSELVDK